MTGKIVVLTGGVGGAKLVLGLSQIVPPEQITAIVNTGDDFKHLGLSVSPDIDTLLYTLAGKADQEKGWGRAGESWSFMGALRSLGGEDWFLLGDGDLALHILRTHQLRAGRTLAEITADFATAWGIGMSILPMSDDPVATILNTDDGDLEFQRYFVDQRCAPPVCAIRFQGANSATAAPGVVAAITDPATSAILIAPSNPYLSIDPILAVPGIKEALKCRNAPVVAISPIIGGKAVKGPTAKLMTEFGLPISSITIAQHYKGIIDGILVDTSEDCTGLQVDWDATDTLMVTLADRVRVAEVALSFTERLRK